jgi:hypothetical protein
MMRQSVFLVIKKVKTNKPTKKRTNNCERIIIKIGNDRFPNCLNITLRLFYSFSSMGEI